MAHKPLFGELIAAHKGLADELKAVDVAADLTLLLNHAGVSRADLARKMGWSRARVSQVLSGQENITVQTIAAVAGALGYTFDTVFRKADVSAASQPWTQRTALTLEMQDEPDVQSWMSRKTMKPVQERFHGAYEVQHMGLTFDASNREFMVLEEACAA
jgi:transcriptional regulator with XRE-family HTH domain